MGAEKGFFTLGVAGEGVADVFGVVLAEHGSAWALSGYAEDAGDGNDDSGKNEYGTQDGSGVCGSLFLDVTDQKHDDGNGKSGDEDQIYDESYAGSFFHGVSSKDLISLIVPYCHPPVKYFSPD